VTGYKDTHKCHIESLFNSDKHVKTLEDCHRTLSDPFKTTLRQTKRNKLSNWTPQSHDRSHLARASSFTN
jgi:hypothetical protein